MKNNFKLAALIAVIVVFVGAAFAIETWKFSVFAEHFGWHPPYPVLALIWFVQLMLVLANFALHLTTPTTRSRRPARY